MDVEIIGPVIMQIIYSDHVIFSTNVPITDNISTWLMTIVMIGDKLMRQR